MIDYGCRISASEDFGRVTMWAEIVVYPDGTVRYRWQRHELLDACRAVLCDDRYRHGAIDQLFGSGRRLGPSVSYLSAERLAGLGVLPHCGGNGIPERVDPQVIVDLTREDRIDRRSKGVMFGDPRNLEIPVDAAALAEAERIGQAWLARHVEGAES